MERLLMVLFEKTGLRSPQNAVKYLVTCYIIFILCKVLSRILSDPLKGLPGPLWSRITSLPISLETIKGRRAQELDRLHKKYGPFVRIGPTEVSIGDYQYYRPIYNDSKSIRKDTNFYSAATFTGLDNIFQMTNPAQHLSRRRLSAGPYSLQSINSLTPLIRKKAEVLAASMITGAAQSPSSTVDVYELCGLYSLEVICQAAFATDLSADSKNDGALKLLKAMDRSAQTLLFTSAMPWLLSTGLGKRVPGHVGVCYQAHAYWQLKSREMVDQLLSVTSGGVSTDHNLLAPLLNGTDSFLNRKLTHDELVEEAMGIMFAGSGTTSTTLTYLFYALACPENAEIQNKLRREVNSLPPGDVLAVRNSTYINAVIKETFRLFPTIISTLPRVLGQSFQLGHYILPAGTVVGMQNYIHHRNPSVFEDPDRFNPDRWLESSKEMELSLTPFSLGRQNCIGQNLAWEELYLAVDAVMRSKATLRLSEEMAGWEMEMEDRFNIAPKGRRLLIHVAKEM